MIVKRYITKRFRLYYSFDYAREFYITPSVSIRTNNLSLMGGSRSSLRFKFLRHKIHIDYTPPTKKKRYERSN